MDDTRLRLICADGTELNRELRWTDIEGLVSAREIIIEDHFYGPHKVLRKLLGGLRPEQQNQCLGDHDWGQALQRDYVAGEVRLYSGAHTSSRPRQAGIVDLDEWRWKRAHKITPIPTSRRLKDVPTGLVNPPSVTTLKEIRRIVSAPGYQITDLLDDYDNCNRGGLKLPEERVELVKRTVIELFARSGRMTISGIQNHVSGILTEEAGEYVAAPAYKTIKRVISTMDNARIIAARLGPKRTRETRGMNSEGPRYSRFGEMVYMDCWKIDIVLRLNKLGIWMKMTPTQRKEWGARRKIWVCVAIDLATRMVIGIGFGLSESTELTRRVLRMAVSDKSAFVSATRSGAPPPPNYGIEALGTDSGEAFADDDFRIPALTLIPNTKIGIVKKPWRRGVIERLFGTIKTQFLPYFDGLTFGNTVARGDYDAMGNATMFLEDFGTAFFRYINDVYHLRGHKGLKKQPPINRAIEVVDGTGGADTYTDDRLRLAFGLQDTLPLTDEGLTFAGIAYKTEWLRQLYPGLKTMRVKVDPVNLGCISVAHAGLWHTVPGPIEFCGKGLTEWQNVAAQLARKHGEQARLNFPIVAKALISFAVLGAGARIKAQIHDQSYDSVTVVTAARSLIIQPMYRPASQPTRGQWTLTQGWLSEANADPSPSPVEQALQDEPVVPIFEVAASDATETSPQPRRRSMLKLRAPAHQNRKDRR